MENDKIMEQIDEKFKTASDSISSKLDEVLKEKLKPIEDDLNKMKAVPSPREEDKVMKGGYDNIGDFAKDVASIKKRGFKPSEKLVEWSNLATKTLNESTDSEGGFLVPPQYSNQLWEQSIEGDLIYPRCQEFVTTSNEFHFPAIEDYSHSSSVYGGIILYYKAEEAQYTASHPKFREIVFKLNKLTGLAQVSEELLEDAGVAVAPLISSLFANAVRHRRDKDIISGTGAGQPYGILNCNAKIALTKETGQVADTIVWENMIKAWARLYSKNSVAWIHNHNCLPQLMSMTITGGTASTPVWVAGNDARNAPNGQIFGAPLIPTEHCPTVGDAGDIILADLSHYGVCRKVGVGGGIQMATSMHLYFDYDKMAFKIKFRWDGQPLWASAFTPENGDTLSPFITIAERA